MPSRRRHPAHNSRICAYASSARGPSAGAKTWITNAWSTSRWSVIVPSGRGGRDGGASGGLWGGLRGGRLQGMYEVVDPIPDRRRGSNHRGRADPGDPNRAGQLEIGGGRAQRVQVPVG